MTTTPSITAGGASTSWEAGKANVKRVWDLFGENRVPRLRAWDQMVESELTKRELYEQYAYYLVHTYVITGNSAGGGRNVGGQLGSQVVQNYLSTMINAAKEKYATSTNVETILFFKCVEKGTLEPIYI